MAKEVKAVNDAETKEVTTEKEVKAVNDAETLVPLYLFKDNDNYKDDVFVSVNGERILIKRGVHVMVKKKFADVIYQSMEQDNKTADFITEETNRYQEELKKN